MSQRPSYWSSIAKRAYQRDNYTCQNCGKRGGPYGSAELHAHHGVPRQKGGTDRLSNLTTYCKQCHNAIHHKDKRAPTADQSEPSRSEEESEMVVVGTIATIVALIIAVLLHGALGDIVVWLPVLTFFGIPIYYALTGDPPDEEWLLRQGYLTDAEEEQLRRKGRL